jgi:hypothetical protein
MNRLILAASLSLASITCGPYPGSACDEIRTECRDVCRTVCDGWDCWDECRQECTDYCIDTSPAPEQCRTDVDCPRGNRCESDGVCRPAPCRTDSDCGTSLRCESDGACRPLPVAADGSLCAPCSGRGACATGAFCLDLDIGGSVCGAPCGGTADCPSGFRCADYGITRQCTPIGDACDRLPASTRCQADVECPSGQACSGGACVADEGSGDR